MGDIICLRTYKLEKLRRREQKSTVTDGKFMPLGKVLTVDPPPSMKQYFEDYMSKKIALINRFIEKEDVLKK